MARTIAVSVAALVSGFAVLAAPGASQAQGRSLLETFDLIQAAIASQGAVVWEGFVHDSAPAAGESADWTYQRRVETNNFSYDLPGCTFSFHYKVTTNGEVSTDIDAGAPLRLARIIKVASEASLVAQRDAQSGHPTWSSRIQPAIYDVDVIRGDGVDNAFSFYDLQTANRVAAAFEHAAALCGVTPATGF
jgi:hypothetical protein